MSGHWSREEVEACVSDYFAMLQAELQGIPYSKTDHRRSLRRLLNQRSETAIERKHMNVSAVLLDLGYPWIEGYKPYRNYQQLLANVVIDRLAIDRTLVKVVEDLVNKPAVPLAGGVLPVWENPPSRAQRATAEETEFPYRVSTGQRNYLAQEAGNSRLGRAGEELVLEFEAHRLRKAGVAQLAGRVEHVAATRGDGLGYDILSYDANGAERLIEVKTTRFGKHTPFFITRNELACSKARPSEFHLYRIFAFGAEPRLFGLRGSVDKTCQLSPTQFRARVS